MRFSISISFLAREADLGLGLSLLNIKNIFNYFKLWSNNYVLPLDHMHKYNLGHANLI